MTPSNLLWRDFLSQVLVMMGLEGQRTGTGVAEQRMGYIRQGVGVLQRAIDQYRVNHETVYQPQDLVTEGSASRGVKPPQSVIRSVFLIKTCSDQCTGTAKCDRWDTEPWPWSDRMALVQGRVPVNSGRGLFCPDPQGYTFYVYPEVFDCWLLSVHWDGLKLDFNDQDETPFNEQTASVVAIWAKAWMNLEVEQNTTMFGTLMTEFAHQKLALWTEEREKTQAKG